MKDGELKHFYNIDTYFFNNLVWTNLCIYDFLHL